MTRINRYLLGVLSILALIYACAQGTKVIPGRDDSVDYGDYGQQVAPGDYGDYGEDVRRRKTIKQ